jgi:uncharacterized protein (TIGR02594 family)
VAVTDQAKPDFEHEKLELERERDRREYALREREISLKERDANRNMFHNPVIVAIAAAALGLASNAVVALIGVYNEERKAEYGRILEMLKVGDPDRAAANLKLLLDAGLYSDSNGKLAAYLESRKTGEGAALAAPSGTISGPRQEISQSIINGLKRQLDDRNRRWMALVIDELGYLEDDQGKVSARIIEYQRTIGNENMPELPWSSAFANWALKICGLKGTNSGDPRKWLEWGVNLEKPYFGAIVVIAKPGGLPGVVGFFVSETETDITLIGGNIKNSVSQTTMPKGSVLAYRWPEGLALPVGK